jgi:hypothetical protein
LNRQRRGCVLDKDRKQTVCEVLLANPSRHFTCDVIEALAAGADLQPVCSLFHSLRVWQAK